MVMGAVNGAQNSDLFRQQMIHNQLPSESSINSEGLLNEYYFQDSKKTDQLIDAECSASQLLNIYTKKLDTYISVALHSSADGKNQRQPLNLVIVLDVSGSMNEYFHPQRSAPENQQSASVRESKIDVAKQVLHELIGNMDVERERLGIVLFNHQATLLQPIRSLKKIDRTVLHDRISNIHADGSTNMESGMTMAISMLTDMLAEDSESRTNNSRVIFLTDALPNVGGREKCLLDLARRAAESSSIFITYIGVGLNFNSELVYELTKIRASNYFSVHSRDGFRQILLTDFNYIVTPIAFNIQVFLQSDRYEIDRVYGIPESERSSHMFTIDTYSASALNEANRVKGSLFLVKLKEKPSINDSPSDNEITVKIKYERATDGERQILPSALVKINGYNSELGVRKAILLVQYTELIRAIIRDVHERTKSFYEKERASLEHKLKISRMMKEDLLKFRQHFIDEMKAMDDQQLTHELDIIDQFRYADEI